VLDNISVARRSPAALTRDPARRGVNSPGRLLNLLLNSEMPLFYFKLVDTIFISDYGAHDLPDETAAQIAALDLAT
jgi:hypothetical protein